MLWPLLIMATAFTSFYVTMVMVRMRNQILLRERNSGWLKEMLRLS